MLVVDVVSVCTRVIRYHDVLLIVCVLMYLVVCGKTDVLFLVDFLIVRLNANSKL